MKPYTKLAILTWFVVGFLAFLFYLFHHELWLPLAFSFLCAPFGAFVAGILKVKAGGVLVGSKNGVGASGVIVGWWFGMVLGPTIYLVLSSVILSLKTWYPRF